MRNTVSLRFAFLLCVGLCDVSHAQPARSSVRAEDPEADIARLCAPQRPYYRIPAACTPLRFSTYEPLYAVKQKTADDESSLRAQYSFRYALFIPDCLSEYGASMRNGESAMPDERRKEIAEKARSCLLQYDAHTEFFLSYTGMFDFYMNTRDSGPVVNRISNPGGHYRRTLMFGPRQGINIAWVDVGFEHKSDGQTTNPNDRVTDPTSPNFGRFRAQVEFEQGNHAYIDSISQDTNYVMVSTLVAIGERTDLELRYKPFYVWDKTVITWGPMADQNVKVSDYDRFRFGFSFRVGDEKTRRNDERRFFADWTIGDKALKTDSLDLGLYWPSRVLNLDVPLFVRMHFGPMNTLSDFTREQNSLGIGFLLVQ